MSVYTLNTQVFLNTTTAVTVSSGWIPVDFKYSGNQNRSIIINRVSASDAITILVKNAHYEHNRDNGLNTLIAETTATATAYGASDPLSIAVGLVPPFTHVKVRKDGTNGGVVAVGVI